MGTVFLACEESGASFLHRQALRGKKAGHTALTKGFTGRLARGIHNRLLQELNQDGTAISCLIRCKEASSETSRSRPRRRAIGSPPAMGWSKCQSFYMHRRIGFFDLIGRRDF